MEKSKVAAAKKELETEKPPKSALDLYPEKVPESQGDLADRAEIEIEQEIEELIMKVRQRLRQSQPLKKP